MAQEAVQVEGPYEVHDFTVAVGTTIEKGTLCKGTDPRTAAATSAADNFVGIASTEKNLTDNATELGLWTTGTFDLFTIGPVITMGSMVSMSGANLVKLATEAEVVTGQVVGKALETGTAGTAQEAIEVKLGVFV
ncbi:hypothetical protein LCGC14_2301420 [marine sediment metagenome]|uniref:Uncharacterized protein n=1 Tax=marine sediment metagenome TaxID=412755 RepID=A0A0F9CNW0_9ZZZZ